MPYPFSEDCYILPILYVCKGTRLQRHDIVKNMRARRDSNPSPRLRRPLCYPSYTTGPVQNWCLISKVWGRYFAGARYAPAILSLQMRGRRPNEVLSSQFLNSVYPQHPQETRSLWVAMNTPGPHLGQTGSTPSTASKTSPQILHL